MRIGPGLIVALAVVGYVVWLQKRPARIERPVVIRQPASAAATGVPDPGFVLDRARDLRLSDRQRGQVRRLAAQYARKVRPLQKALDEAAARAGHRLEAVADGGNRLTPQQMQEATRGVAELSASLAEARAAAWPHVAAVLTAAQQARAKEAWSAAHQLVIPPQRAGRTGGG